MTCTACARAVCADFEKQHGRAPAASDLPALLLLGTALARDHGIATSVINAALLEEYVALADQELPPVCRLFLCQHWIPVRDG